MSIKDLTRLDKGKKLLFHRGMRVIIKILLIFAFIFASALIISYNIESNKLKSTSRASSEFIPEQTPVPNKIVDSLTVCPEEYRNTPQRENCNYFGGEGIQQAIDNVNQSNPETAYKTILIKEGNYTRNTSNRFIQDRDHYRQCMIDSRGKNIILQGETDIDNKPLTVLYGNKDILMSGICANSGKFQIRNIKISGFMECSLMQSSPSPLFTPTITPNPSSGDCVSGYGVVASDKANVEITSSSITENIASGIGVYGSAEVSIQSSEISINGIFERKYGPRGKGISISDQSRATIQGSEIRNNGNIGIEINKKATVLLMNNLIIDHGDTNLLVGEGIYLDSSSNVDIVNNTIFRNSLSGIFIGPSLPSINSSGKINVINNILAGSNYDYDTAVTIDYKNGVGIAASRFEDYNKKPLNIIIKNNFFWDNINGCGSSIISCDTSSNLNNQNQGPFIDDFNNYHLKYDSPAIDAGNLAIKDPDGSRSDIGAYGGPGACLLDPKLPGCN